MVQNILTEEDFNRLLDDYWGRTIPHTPTVQTTSNITGEETLADGSTVDIKCYVMKTGQNYDYKKMGLMEQGDMIGLFKVADNVKINSKVTVNGEVFKVKESFDVPGIFDSAGTATYIYTVANLFLED